MKVYCGYIGIGHQTCQNLGQMANGHGKTGISQEKLDERVAIESRHDHEAIRGTDDLKETERFQQLCQEHAGRCSSCGELIGEVDRCPFCKTQQRFAGQRNSAQRKTIGGFCGRTK